MCGEADRDVRRKVLNTHRELEFKVWWLRGHWLGEPHGQAHFRVLSLLLEEDVVLLQEPGVGEVARVGLCLAGEEGVL